jgi:hypothetical protein
MRMEYWLYTTLPLPSYDYNIGTTSPLPSHFNILIYASSILTHPKSETLAHNPGPIAKRTVRLFIDQNSDKQTKI